MVNSGQSYLETISILEMLLSKMDAKSRTQIHKSVLDDIYQGIISIGNKLGATQAPIWLADFSDSIKEYKESEITYLTNEMKTTIVDALTEMETEVATKAYQYFCEHDFSPREKTIPLLRKCVELYHFG